MYVKEKAIEAFDDVYDELYPKGWSVDCGKKLMIVKDYLLKPTLDDCIAVVEHLAYKHCPHGEYDNLVTKEILLEVYTAIKGLKEAQNV